MIVNSMGSHVIYIFNYVINHVTLLVDVLKIEWNIEYIKVYKIYKNRVKYRIYKYTYV
jgi:hypothetical protein